MVTMVRAESGEPSIPPGFPILLDAGMAIIEPAFAWLIEHATLRGRGRASETVRTYGEHLHDWFDTLEQSDIAWDAVDENVIAAYRNRMLEGPSPHTGRPYARTTINARVHTVCRFYAWARARRLIDDLPYMLAEHMLLELEARLRMLATQNAGLLQRALTAERRSQRLEERNAELVRTLEAFRQPAAITRPNVTDDDDI